MKNLFTKRNFLSFVIAGALLFASFSSVSYYSKISFSNQAQAHPHCLFCRINDCLSAVLKVVAAATQARLAINTHIDADFVIHRMWIYEIFWKKNLLTAMMLMTEQLSAVGMYQMLGVGQLIDAKDQLETQRDINILKAKAIHTYQPNVSFCSFGTNTRSLSNSRHKSYAAEKSLNSIAMQRLQGNISIAGSASSEQDKKARWEQFTSNYCHIYNNGWDIRAAVVAGVDNISGLVPACSPTAIGTTPPPISDSGRVNADINYARTVAFNRTINFDTVIDPSTVDIPGEPSEETLVALSKNLFGHNLQAKSLRPDGKKEEINFYDLRRVTALRSVALNSFNSIASLRSSGSAKEGLVDTRQFMAAVINDLGIADEERIWFLIGENPSFYSQMEILAKRLLQSPTFYSDLYVSEPNIRRISVVLEVLETMIDYFIAQSVERQKMLVSSMVAVHPKMRADYNRINTTLSTTRAE